LIVLRVSDSLKLIDDAQTQTFVVFGKRGSGKTTFAVRLAEQMFKRGLPFVVLDPQDVWWGLKANKDGKGKGLAVYVFGGNHADLTLEPTAGALMADVAVDERISMVLSVKHFSGKERSKFVTDFAERLFQRNTEPLHVFVEEADEFVPQRIMFKGEGRERMLGAMEKLVKRGRSSGIGVTLITQRAATVNKNVTTQAEVLVAYRVLGPQDVVAIKQWIVYNQGEEEMNRVLASLATLKKGEAWVWSPAWPEDDPIGLECVQMLDRETFNSSSTPKAGEKRSQPVDLAPVDMEALREKMAATIERAKANDPKALKTEVARLTAELAKRSESAPAETKTVTVEVPIFTARDRQRLTGIKEWLSILEARWKEVRGYLESSEKTLAEVRDRLSKIDALDRPAPVAPPPRTYLLNEQHTKHVQKLPPRPARPKGEPGDDDDPLRPARRKILDSLAFLASINISQPSRNMLALFVGKSPGSGGYNNDLGKLRSSGYLDYPAEGLVTLTAEGTKEADASNAPRSLAELHAQVERLVKPARWEIVSTLIPLYPKFITREDLAARIGRSSGSGGFNNNLGMLRSSGIIDYPGEGNVVVTEALFPEGLR
jgi:GTPase SAR1 family protein